MAIFPNLYCNSVLVLVVKKNENNYKNKIKKRIIKHIVFQKKAKRYEMNFYSDEIINDILDHAPIESLIDTLDTFKEKTRNTLHRFSGNDIQTQYVDALLGDERNKDVFYCMDHEFAIENCPVIMIYRKSRDETRYYILMLCTKPNFRKQGYASKLLDGFVEKIREEQKEKEQKEKEQNKKKQKEKEQTKKQEKIKIILSSVENAVLFYESYGFRWTMDTLSDHEELTEIEKNEEGKEYFIMELVIK